MGDDNLFSPLDDIPLRKRKKRESKFEKERHDRMRRRTNRKPFLFYPEDQGKGNWDLFITLVLIFSCLQTPYRISFIP